ncbi:MAG: hypothetical protein P1P64_07195 [Treponemataceae bacterium]
MSGRSLTHVENFPLSLKLIRKPALRFLRLIKALYKYADEFSSDKFLRICFYEDYSNTFYFPDKNVGQVFCFCDVL